MKASSSVLGILGAILLVACMSVPASSDEKQITDRSEIEKVIRDYILDNPEVLVESLQNFQERQRIARKEADREAVRRYANDLLDDAVAPIDGNRDGDVTIVEFVDHRCPACKRFHPIVKELVATDGKIKRIFRMWPILGPKSVVAARAVLAAREQGGSTALHNALMQAQSELDENAVMRIARSLGLDSGKLKADMASSKVAEDIERNHRLAEKLGLTGTPSFIVGTELLRGGVNLDTMRALVEATRQGG